MSKVPLSFEHVPLHGLLGLLSLHVHNLRGAAKCDAQELLELSRKEDVRLPGKRNSNSQGARPVHLIITMVRKIWTNRLSIKNSLSVLERLERSEMLGACLDENLVFVGTLLMRNSNPS